jgi:hypothetical protein
MLVLRATRKLLGRMKCSPAADPPASTTALGGWYANLIIARPAHLVLCVSERTLLPVLVPAKDIERLVPRLQTAVAEMLETLGVSSDVVAREVAEMEAVSIAKTANRSILGCMTDFGQMFECIANERRPLLDVALWLARSPMSPLGMKSPDDVTRALFVVDGPDHRMLNRNIPPLSALQKARSKDFTEH